MRFTAKGKIKQATWRYGPTEVEEALEAGAVGFIARTASVEEVADAIQRANAGESPVHSRRLKEAVGKVQQVRKKKNKLLRLMATLSPERLNFSDC